MNFISDSYKKYQMSWLYAGLGAATLIMGILTMDGLIPAKEDLSLIEVYGLCITILSGLLIIAAYLMYRIDKIEAQLRKIERDDLLQDLQQEEES